MFSRRCGSTVVRRLAAMCLALAVQSCGHSPTAPGGRLEVSVTQDDMGPAAGKRIELDGTDLARTTDKSGLAVFTVKAGTYIVRAYDIGTPGPAYPFVEVSVQVESARTSLARFNDCTMCQ